MFTDSFDVEKWGLKLKPIVRMTRENISSLQVPDDFKYAIVLKKLKSDLLKMGATVSVSLCDFYSEHPIKMNNFVDELVYRFYHSGNGELLFAYEISERNSGEIYRELNMNGEEIFSWSNHDMPTNEEGRQARQRITRVLYGE